MFKEKIINIMVFFFVVTVFSFTYILSSYSIWGDHNLYRETYDSLHGLEFAEAFINYSLKLTSTEIVHFLITWIGSNADIDHDILMAFFNAILAYYIFRLFSIWNVNIFISAFVILTNFYLVALYIDLMRLKFGFIFLVLSMVYPKKSYYFAFLSIVSHSQMLIIYSVFVFKSFIFKVIDVVIKQKISKKSIFYLFVTLIVAIILYVIIGSQILSKVPEYYKERDVSVVLKSLLFCIVATFYSRNKVDTIFIFLPILIASFILGGERINIIAYCLFLFVVLRHNRGVNFAVIVSSLYYFYQSINYIVNLIERGNGYAFQ